MMSKNDIAKLTDAIAQLGQIMEDYPLAIMDVSRLPLPKDEMKKAIKTIYSLNPIPTARAFLPLAFLHLANFQVGVGESSINGNSENLSELEKWLVWSDLILAETKSLESEWQSFARAGAH